MLPSFDPSRATQALCYHRASFQMPNSMVAIADSYGSTILQIYFGTNDQLIAERMEKILKPSGSSPKRVLSPQDHDFADLCSLLVNLRLPLVARKKNPSYYGEGYLVDAAEFYRMVKAARSDEYRNASLYAGEKTFSIDNTLRCYDNIDLSFLKKRSDQP